MPFVAMSVILCMVTIGISTEFMRDFETVNQLDFASSVASIYSLGYGVNADRTYSLPTAQANIQNYLLGGDTASFNLTDSGPNLSTTNQPVNYLASDINFIPNPVESSLPVGRQEFFLDLTVRRQGVTAIPQIFMPLAYIKLSTVGLPTGTQTFSPVRTIEFLGQPATTIGAGDPNPPTSTTQIPPTKYQFACLPIAISIQQFAGIATSSAASPSATFALDVDGLSGNIHGCFVDLVSLNGSVSPFNTASSANVNTQLTPLLNYFMSGGTPPSSVKYTDVVSAYNVQDPNFPWTTISRQCTALVAANISSSGSNKNFIVPVVQSSSPTAFTPPFTVAGFAWMQLRAFNAAANPSQSTFTVAFSDSVPVRNACINPFLQTTINANGTSSLAPVPPIPFAPRTYNAATNSMSPRPFGVVLAPVRSPRLILGG